MNRRAPPTGKVTAASLIKSYEIEAQRQTLLVRKADLAQTRLSFVVNALRRLFEDEEFLTLLRAEAMHTLPRPLAEPGAAAIDSDPHDPRLQGPRAVPAPEAAKHPEEYFLDTITRRVVLITTGWRSRLMERELLVFPGSL